MKLLLDVIENVGPEHLLFRVKSEFTFTKIDIILDFLD